MSNKAPLILKFSAALIVCLIISAGAQMTFDQHNIDNDLRTVSSLIRVGDFNRAAAILERMRLTYGDDNRIMDLYKQIYREAKMYSQLEAEIRREMENKPPDLLLTAELGEARFLQNDNDGADSLWNRAIEIGKSDEVTYRIVADFMIRHGLNESAIEIFLRGRKFLSKPTLFSLELAGIYESLRDYPRAVNEYLIQVMELPDRLGFISTKIRGLLEDTEDSQQIIQIITQKIKESPGRTELYEILGDLYIKQSEMDKALECYKVIGSKQNDDGQSLLRFAARAFDSKAFRTAISAVDEYYKSTNNNTYNDLANLIKAKSQMASGFYDEALANFLALKAAAKDYRIKDEAAVSAGLIYANTRNNCDSALTIWNAMLNTSRDPVMQNKARLEMAVCLIKIDNFPLAAEHLQRVISGKSDNAGVERATFLKGEMLFYEGKFDEAGESFKEQIRQFPQGDFSNDALVRMGVIATAGKDDSNKPFLQKFAQAMKAEVLGNPLQAGDVLSDSAFRESSIAEQASFYAAEAYAAASSRDKAIISYKYYIDTYIDGFYVDRAYFGLGVIYEQDPLTYTDAKSMYSKILESFPDGPVTEMARQRLLQINSPGKIG